MFGLRWWAGGISKDLGIWLKMSPVSPVQPQLPQKRQHIALQPLQHSTCAVVYFVEQPACTAVHFVQHSTCAAQRRR